MGERGRRWKCNKTEVEGKVRMKGKRKEAKCRKKWGSDK
jgi:hypothetical protein